MSQLFRLARRLIATDRWAFARGLALSIAVLAMGAALLGLSGWFVTAAAAAGVAGVGIGFDFFRPSAGVRFLALGRAGARYGERMLTHDATLRALSALRGALYGGVTRLPHEEQARLRGAEALNRLTADVDALDGLALRLVLPLAAALATHAGAFVALWYLVAPATAGAVLAAYIAGGTAALVYTARRAHAPASRAEAATQALRARVFDLMQNRADLALSGALPRFTAQAQAAATEEEAARTALDTIERRGGAALALTTGLAAAAALASGGALAAAGTISPARAAMGLFVALALGETLALLRRGLAELGRMQGAATRVLALTDTPARPAPGPQPALSPEAPLLAATGLAHRRPGAARATFGPLDLTLVPGEVVLITGTSGAGKSTLLATLAGLTAPSAGQIELKGLPLADWPEAALRATLTLVPQRAALIAGTVAENLALAAPEASDAQLWEALEAAQLGPLLRTRDGLATRLGPGGRGLSGGEARRLALARALLRRPDVLLLDEPTEALDAPTAQAMIAALRTALPDSALVIVSHRAPDAAFATRHLTLAARP